MITYGEFDGPQTELTYVGGRVGGRHFDAVGTARGSRGDDRLRRDGARDDCNDVPPMSERLTDNVDGDIE